MLSLLLLLLAQLSVNVIPKGYLPPHSSIEVVVTIEKDSHNRGVAVEVLSDDYYSKSQRELEGESANTRQRFTFRDLREGDYQIYATLQTWEDGQWKEKVEKFSGTVAVR
jgi:hypothetical protein